MTSIGRQIEDAIAREKWDLARRLALTGLHVSPSDHWLLARVAITYHEQRQYAVALRWSEKAKRVAPRCPLVLWGHAVILESLGRSQEAAEVYESLIVRGVESLATGECGEGVEWAESLVRDCVERLEDVRK